MKILGISGAFGHDAAAALVVDGVVVGACEEERFTRQKRAIRQPAMHSVQACLDMAALGLEQIDCIAIGWNPDLAPKDRRLTDSLDQLMTSNRFYDDASPQIHRVAHHRAHAALGFFTSGFDEAAIVVVDGQSEDASTTIYHGRGSAIAEVTTFDIPSSLGFFYAAITRYVGFTPGNAGKTMGLAALGSATYDFPEIALVADGYVVNMPGRTKADRMIGWLQLCDNVFGPAGRRSYSMGTSTGLLRSSAPVLPHLRDAAASAQAALERTLRHLADTAIALTGSTNLVLSGGVALNCSANGRLRKATGSRGLFVSGAVSDAGTALGAALAVAAEHSILPPPSRSRTLFLGPEFDLTPTIELARRLGIIVQEPPGGVGTSVARRVAANQVGGWFRGRAEYGPRALGGRSIVARSDRVDVGQRVNSIKGREHWRPLAPAMSAATASALSIDGDGLDFMVEARWLGEDAEDGPVAGILHADRSIRPLVIDADSHPLADLLNAMEHETGSAAITNTSFNVESEPMVNSPVDALRTFASADLDFLVLGDTLLTKPT